MSKRRSRREERWLAGSQRYRGLCYPRAMRYALKQADALEGAGRDAAVEDPAVLAVVHGTVCGLNHRAGIEGLRLRCFSIGHAWVELRGADGTVAVYDGTYDFVVPCDEYYRVMGAVAGRVYSVREACRLAHKQ